MMKNDENLMTYVEGDIVGVEVGETVGELYKHVQIKEKSSKKKTTNLIYIHSRCERWR